MMSPTGATLRGRSVAHGGRYLCPIGLTSMFGQVRYRMSSETGYTMIAYRISSSQSTEAELRSNEGKVKEEEEEEEEFSKHGQQLAVYGGDPEVMGKDARLTAES